MASFIRHQGGCILRARHALIVEEVRLSNGMTKCFIFPEKEEGCVDILLASTHQNNHAIASEEQQVQLLLVIVGISVLELLPC